MKYSTLRVPTDALAELRDAAASSDVERLRAAVVPIAEAEDQPVTLIETPAGFTYRPVRDKPVSLMHPLIVGEDFVIPVRLRWLKREVLTEARGSRDEAGALHHLLGCLLDGEPSSYEV